MYIIFATSWYFWIKQKIGHREITGYMVFHLQSHLSGSDCVLYWWWKLFLSEFLELSKTITKTRLYSSINLTLSLTNFCHIAVVHKNIHIYRSHCVKRYVSHACSRNSTTAYLVVLQPLAEICSSQNLVFSIRYRLLIIWY